MPSLFQILSDKGENKEAMEQLKKALKLEPATKVRLYTGEHVCPIVTTCASLPGTACETQL